VLPAAGVELVVVQGPGGATFVRVYDVTAGTELTRFRGFAASFTGGLRGSTGQGVAGGPAEVLVTPQSTGPALVNVYDAATGIRVRRIRMSSATARGGLFVSPAELVVSPGAGLTILSLVNPDDGNRFDELLVFPTSFNPGARVSSFDLDVEGTAELVVSGGKGRPEVRVIDPESGLVRLTSFLALAEAMTAGLFVAGGVR
jgi:hypothetical protein